MTPYVAAALVAVTVAGCSNAADYAPLMSSFSDATEKARSALESYDKAAASRLTDLRRQAATSKPVGVRVVEGDCLTSSARCRVVFLTGPDDPDPTALTVTSLAPNHLAAMREIALYAKALEDLSAADATPAVKTAVDKALAATVGLASVVAPTASPALSAFAAPAGQLIVWGYGKYQESIKLEGLRFAVNQMEPTMNDAVAKFGTVARHLSAAEVRRMSHDMGAAAVEFEMVPTRVRLDALLASAQMLDDALSLAPQEVFRKIGSSHAELARALNGREPMSLEKAFEMVNRLSADAETLHRIAEGFRKAAEKKS